MMRRLGCSSLTYTDIESYPETRQGYCTNANAINNEPPVVKIEETKVEMSYILLLQIPCIIHKRWCPVSFSVLQTLIHP